MKHIFLYLMIYFFCTAAVFAQKSVTLTGQIAKNPGFTEVFLENIISQAVLDSADVDKSGNFSFNTSIEKTDFYKLRFSQEHYLLLVLNPGEKVQINLDATNMYAPKISGSQNSELVYTVFTKMRDYDMEMQRLTEEYEAKKKDYIRNFVLQNSSSLSSLFFIESLSIDDDLQVYKKLDENLMKLYPDNYMVLNLHNKVKSMTGIEVGSTAPEIDLPGVDGKNIKLTSLRGKYVLIDFWAAWCGPCRRESPNMVAIYNKYNKQGFEIYSVSLDQTKDAWEKAIKKDGLAAWSHVSDLKYWSSVAAKDYGVDAIPFTVLVDKEGIIIAKGLRGDKLNAKLAEIFE